MAVPFDDATTLLSTISDAVRQVYHEKFQDMIPRFGNKTNRLFKMSKRRIDGDGINIQVKDRNLYGARVNNDINADFGTARSFSADVYKVTLSETPTANHFRRVGMPLQVSHLDIKRRMNTEASAVDFKAELVAESMRNIAEHIALRRHLDSTTKIASINGTPAKNDNRLFASCSAISTSGGARFPVDGGSIAGLQPGMMLDIYTSGTFKNNAIVSDYNPRDTSVGVLGVTSASATDGSTSINVNAPALADNDDLYLSGEKDKNILSIGHWFSTPSTGDSFFGKDRTDATNRYLLPHVSGPTSSRQFTKTDIDNLSIELGYIQEDPDGGYVALTTPELDQRYRNEIGNDVLIPYPTDEAGKKLFANYGFDGGGVYRHPTMGRIVLQSDPFAAVNTIRLLRIGDWETLSAPTSGGENGWEWLPGDIAGGWYRMDSTTPGGGRTTTYRMDGMLLMCDICLRPRVQAAITNITA